MRTRTKIFNFRVSQKTLKLIERRAKQLGISKTKLVERGLIQMDPAFVEVFVKENGGIFRGIVD